MPTHKWLPTRKASVHLDRLLKAANAVLEEEDVAVGCFTDPCLRPLKQALTDLWRTTREIEAERRRNAQSG